MPRRKRSESQPEFVETGQGPLSYVESLRQAIGELGTTAMRVTILPVNEGETIPAPQIRHGAEREPKQTLTLKPGLVAYRFEMEKQVDWSDIGSRALELYDQRQPQPE